MNGLKTLGNYALVMPFCNWPFAHDYEALATLNLPLNHVLSPHLCLKAQQRCKDAKDGV